MQRIHGLATSAVSERRSPIGPQAPGLTDLEREGGDEIRLRLKHPHRVGVGLSEYGRVGVRHISAHSKGSVALDRQRMSALGQQIGEDRKIQGKVILAIGDRGRLVFGIARNQEWRHGLQRRSIFADGLELPELEHHFAPE